MHGVKAQRSQHRCCPARATLPIQRARVCAHASRLPAGVGDWQAAHLPPHQAAAAPGAGPQDTPHSQQCAGVGALWGRAHCQHWPRNTAAQPGCHGSSSRGSRCHCCIRGHRSGCHGRRSRAATPCPGSYRPAAAAAAGAGAAAAVCAAGWQRDRRLRHDSSHHRRESAHPSRQRHSNRHKRRRSPPHKQTATSCTPGRRTWRTSCSSKHSCAVGRCCARLVISRQRRQQVHACGGSCSSRWTSGLRHLACQ